MGLLLLPNIIVTSSISFRIYASNSTVKRSIGVSVSAGAWPGHFIMSLICCVCAFDKIFSVFKYLLPTWFKSHPVLTYKSFCYLQKIKIIFIPMIGMNNLFILGTYFEDVPTRKFKTKNTSESGVCFLKTKGTDYISRHFSQIF